MKIHHATLTKAKKFKITLTVEDNEVVATSAKGERLAAGLQGNKVLEDAITKATGHAPKGKAKLPEQRLADGKVKLAAGKKARKAKPAPHSEEEAELDAEDGDDSDADQSKSIVKAKYKARYKPTKDKCGDTLSFEINEHVTVEDDETGEKKVSKKLLRAFAEANGCWVPAYGSLVSRTGGWNAGMARMNVANRLRAKIRHYKKEMEEEYQVIWPKV